MSFNPGGGGVANANDVALNSPVDDEVLTYDGGLGKWVNQVAQGGGVTSVNSRTGAVVLAKADVSLGNVDNTSDATKNAAVAVLTNKDLTSGTNTFPTLNQSTTGNAATATALQTPRLINGVSFDGTGNITVADATKVPTTTMVNGHALSADVTVTATDVGLGSVTNNAQLKASDLDTDGTLTANSDTKVASQKATKTYADTKVTNNVTITADQAAAGWWQHLYVNYAPSTSAPESFFVESSASGSRYRVFWLNENGVPRAAASKAGEVTLKIFGVQSGTQGVNLTEWWNTWNAGNILYAIDKEGKPRIGLGSGSTFQQGAHSIILGPTDPVPTGLPSGTIIVRTT